MCPERGEKRQISLGQTFKSIAEAEHSSEDLCEHNLSAPQPDHMQHSQHLWTLHTKCRNECQRPATEYQSVNTHLLTAYCMRRVWDKPKLWKPVMKSGVIWLMTLLHQKLLPSSPTIEILPILQGHVKDTLLCEASSDYTPSPIFINIILPLFEPLKAFSSYL